MFFSQKIKISSYKPLKEVIDQCVVATRDATNLHPTMATRALLGRLHPSLFSDSLYINPPINKEGLRIRVTDH